MAKVDSKGRIVLPQRVRERLGIEPGTEVEVHEKDGKAVVEPEDDPREIVERMEELIAETSPASEETRPLDTDVDPVARKHRETVRSGAERDADE
ncbi:AbrB/MazE/SpoVT family DNA-binding domain-containing protein [Halobellus sp. GM3]|uniref:AbrB/MazE/SpoVT family DNA-binding domain-containing protein n=1 Tax=Halobellus sp. GM3 TaxID=3458410 RepID=UPI00403E331B